MSFVSAEQLSKVDLEDSSVSDELSKVDILSNNHQHDDLLRNAENITYQYIEDDDDDNSMNQVIRGTNFTAKDTRNLLHELQINNEEPSKHHNKPLSPTLHKQVLLMKIQQEKERQGLVEIAKPHLIHSSPLKPSSSSSLSFSSSILKKSSEDPKSTIISKKKKRSSTISEGTILPPIYDDHDSLDFTDLRNHKSINPTALADALLDKTSTPAAAAAVTATATTTTTTTPNYSVHFSHRKHVMVPSSDSSPSNNTTDLILKKNTKENTKKYNYSTDMTDESDSDPSPTPSPTRNSKKIQSTTQLIAEEIQAEQQHQQEETDLDTPNLWQRMYSDPQIPLTLSLYLQVAVNFALFTVVFGFIYALVWTVWTDINNKVTTELLEITQEISLCVREYERNHCAPSQRVPALEIACSAWEKCMSRDPQVVSKAKIGAETLAEILNGFIKPISWKTLVFVSFGLVGSFIVNNYFFVSYTSHRYEPDPFQQHQVTTQMRYVTNSICHDEEQQEDEAEEEENNNNNNDRGNDAITPSQNKKPKPLQQQKRVEMFSTPQHSGRRYVSPTKSTIFSSVPRTNQGNNNITPYKSDGNNSTFMGILSRCSPMRMTPKLSPESLRQIMRPRGNSGGSHYRSQR
ncbi:Brr6 protein [Saccharomycopsis crataegensis]|uniref:Brr6 protein n=1 Tax=Saccharomycopsis crataegensis TaxID=43959 RepID=A0AAV5QIS7_9ASCO|nr:Brr6 protein [Saccharomycopsis crataegensis]